MPDEKNNDIPEILVDDELTDVVSSSAGTSNLLNPVPNDLKTWNIAAATFQLAQAVALFYLAATADAPWPWYTNYPLVDEFGIPDPNRVASFAVAWYSPVFITLSGIDHALCVVFWNKYKYYLERNQNPFRYTEYAFSASLMRVMIAQLSGVTDIHLLFLIFVCAALTMALGSLHESINAQARNDRNLTKQNWFAFNLSWIPHFASWLVIFNYFFVSVSKADPPNFVWAIVIILFVLDGTFALLFTLQWFKVGKFRDYIWGEKGFILLSFTAKALLAWINYGGGSRGGNN